ncbi:helix-turn-helix domain-containing protein [Arsenicicoccus sp. oral taxon 190]|uniref:helix-turn-helix domain-containing protein n=1 Tax=Arsenicicoccus sp. oral taxon 190 TaxID=1658671 RepID=UPI000679FE68|nr:helix-turn-helix transcriptional regulator [Arsenicicoccus sp. oral taxon 190]AKT50297.1 hypothetical protein ADJ73_01300 [Arsenicicoccus sp. oral taxon 190]
MPRLPGTTLTVTDLGDYLREQREAAQLSLRQLSELAGVSNPYLSQIERGLRRPSAEILSALAKGLQISAESLYVRAGLLEETPRDERHEPYADHPRAYPPGVVAAIEADPLLTPRQRRTLVDLYQQLTDGAGAAPRHRTTPRPTSTTSTRSTS